MAPSYPSSGCRNADWIFNVNAWRWRVSRGKLKHVKSQATKQAKKIYIYLKAAHTKKWKDAYQGV
jgi:hypothetical protein